MSDADTPAICTLCEREVTQDCRRFGGQCEPFAVILVTGDPNDEEGVGWSEWLPLAYRRAGGWHLWLPGEALPDADAWGLPLAWEGSPVLPACDHVVRLAEVGGWTATPVRTYDTPEIAGFYGPLWARKLDTRIVLTGGDGGEEVAP